VNFANNFRYLGGGYQAWHDSMQTRDRTDYGPDYRVGLIASGDILGSAPEFRQWLLHHNRRRLALEMEAAGAAQAIYQSGRTDLLVIRGISNLADGLAPVPARARLAEMNAVALLAALVTHPDFPPGRTPRRLTAATSGPDPATRPFTFSVSYAREDTVGR